MAVIKTIEIPIAGMDCAECTLHVKSAIGKVDGVKGVEVLLAAQKAIVQLDPALAKMEALQKAVNSAGYSIPSTPGTAHTDFQKKTRTILTVLGISFGAVLTLVIGGEFFGLFEKFTNRIPPWIGIVLVSVAGLPLLIDVIRAAFHKQVISHTLMVIGVIAALISGEWVTAGVVVFLMHIGKYIESFTTNSTRKAVKDLTKLMPETARIERNHEELDVPVNQVDEADVIVVRPGERIPVDGVVITGGGTINQSAVTGESMPIDVQKGMAVYAASILTTGSVRIHASHIGRETILGRIIKMVEDAEAKQGRFQKFADKFSGYYLPVVAGIALLTWLIGTLLRVDGAILHAISVLVVACSCSIALATPIAMLASIGAAAKKGLLIRGGKFIELLDKADIVLIDKTGTLTLGKPRIEKVLCLGKFTENELIELGVTAERYSEHPFAIAVRDLASERGIKPRTCSEFESFPGQGVSAVIDEQCVRIGNSGFVKSAQVSASIQDLENPTGAMLYISVDEVLAGVFIASDRIRSEVPAAIERLKKLGMQKIELITGDNQASAAEIAQKLGIDFRSELLPQHKIEIVANYQEQGHRVIMIGDGINDAPALAKADIGIAMGENGTEIASETADVVLMHEDWQLVPSLVEIGRRTMKVVKMNLIFTGIYNVVGVSLAAFGVLSPVLAAALQSIPDLGILGNSSRLLHQKIITDQTGKKNARSKIKSNLKF